MGRWGLQQSRDGVPDRVMPAPHVSSIPRVMRETVQWVCWRYEPSPSNPEKLTKVPYSALAPGSARWKAESDDPTTWATFKQAIEYHLDNEWTDGIGMVVCVEDDFVGIDLDHCRDPETGEIEPWAQKVVDTVNSYTEITPSAAGLRIFARGTLPPTGRKRGDFEVYESGRYLTVTGQHLEGTPLTVEPRELEIRRVHREVWPEAGPTSDRAPCPTNLSDQELLEKAAAAGNGAKFSALWNGSSAGYPSQSEADLALCNLLAFWTGGNAGQMDTLFRASGLFRPKWDERHYAAGQTYGDHTIESAIRDATEFYTPPLVGERIGRIGRGDGDTGDPDAERTIRAFTDTGNAERLVDQFGDQIRYCPPWKSWLVWDGKRWHRDNQHVAEHLTKRAARSIFGEIIAGRSKEERARILKHAIRTESAAGRMSMLRLARSEPGIPMVPEEMDRDPWLLNVQNGTLDLRTGTLRPHDQQDGITKLAPVCYDPEAACPTFLNFLLRVLPDAEARRFLRYLAGYALTGVTVEQCLAFLYGDGGNGKSTFLTVMHALLGDYAKQAAPGLLMQKDRDRHLTELADLFGARFVASIEVDEGKRMAEELVKQMTGGDKMSARFLFADLFSWMPTHKLFLAANHKPDIRGTDSAIWRRIHLIPFTVKIPEEERDKGLGDTLLTELPGILNWALSGCLEWQKNGLRVPETVRSATQEYREEQDVIGTFLAEHCVIDAQAWADPSTLYAVYQAWCKEAGESPMSNTMFGRRLTDRGIISNHLPNGKRVRRGVRLRGEDER